MVCLPSVSIHLKSSLDPILPRLSTLLFKTDRSQPRPLSKNATWEDPASTTLPFAYDALPSKFYFEVESVGSLEPDNIVQQGIKVLQQKLALLLHDLDGPDVGGGVGDGGPENGIGFGAGGFGGADPGQAGQDAFGGDGFATPFLGGGQGGGSVWGGGATPYGATPYGQNGWAQ